jgi:hypothetical protein
VIENQLAQFNIYISHVIDEPDLLDELKLKANQAGKALEQVTEKIELLENMLFEDGDGKAVAQLITDSPHTYSKEEER